MIISWQYSTDHNSSCKIIEFHRLWIKDVQNAGM